VLHGGRCSACREGRKNFADESACPTADKVRSEAKFLPLRIYVSLQAKPRFIRKECQLRIDLPPPKLLRISEDLLYLKNQQPNLADLLSETKMLGFEFCSTNELLRLATLKCRVEHGNNVYTYMLVHKYRCKHAYCRWQLSS
jgi:hypothetical protein